MAYFRCSLGGGSGNGAVITVAYGAEFYNQTLVATNGTDTVSVLASSSGTADITVPSEGSWVISCTIGADTYTSDPVSVDLSYEATITAIPDGSTVLPTDDIETWLECAGITDKAYTTLAEVLADTDTYTTLLGDSNACDYMARSTTWADMGVVPAMTSSTTPSGTVIYSSENTTNQRYAWKAFDRVKDYASSATDKWVATSATNQYIGYTFTSPTVVKRVYLLPDIINSDICAKDIKIEGSNDGSTWVTLDTRTLKNQSTPTDIYFTIDNDTAYTSYRVYVSNMHSTASGGCIALRCVQFYSDIDITSDADAMRLLGMYDYACEALLSDSTWASAIAGSSYWSNVLVDSVPKYTSDDSAIIRSSQYDSSTYPAWKAFDKNNSTNWAATTAANEYIGYHFTEPILVLKASIRVNYDNSKTRIKNYHIDGSNDGTNWTTLYTGVIQNTSAAHTETVDITNDTAYEYYRVFCIDNYTSSPYMIAADEIQFYGRHGAQTDIIVSAPSDTIYYMDNGSPVTLCTTDTDGIGSVDWSDLPTGDITLYSSVAKNPTDLTADYSKTIKVTKNKVEGYLMPDNTLYWYGWKSNDTVPTNSANGWSYSTYTYVNPSYQTNYVGLTGGSSNYTGIASKNLISSGAIAKCVCEGVTKVDSIYGSLFAIPTKAYTNQSRIMVNVPQELALTQATLTANAYVTVGLALARSIKCYALWYE